MVTNITYALSCANGSGVITVNVTIDPADTIDIIRYELVDNDDVVVFSQEHAEASSNTREFTGIADGVYGLTVYSTNTGGFELDETVVVNCVPDPLTVTHTKTNPTSVGGNQGTITLTVTGGFEPYTYLWSNGATTQNLTGLTAGTYSCTITSFDGQTVNTGPIVLTDPNPCDLTITNIVIVKESYPRSGDATATITVTTSNEGPIEYSLDGIVWQSSNVLTGLEQGSYTAYARQYSCTGTAPFTVVRPAPVYYGTYADVNNNIKRVEIQKRATDGSNTELAMGATPVTITLDGEGSERWMPVRGTTCETEWICPQSFLFIDLYTTDSRGYRIEVYNETANNALIWTGYIKPEVSYEPYIAPPYVIKLTASDGLGLLEHTEFGLTTDFVNAFDLVHHCLTKLDLFVPFATSINLYEQMMDPAQDTLKQMEIHKPVKCLEALEKLVAFDIRIFWNEQKGRFDVVSYDALTKYTNYRIYNKKGVYTGSESNYPIKALTGPRQGGDIIMLGGSGMLEIERGFKQFEVSSLYTPILPLFDFKAFYEPDTTIVKIDAFYDSWEAYSEFYSVYSRPVAVKNDTDGIIFKNKFNMSFKVRVQRPLQNNVTENPIAVFSLKCGSYYLNNNSAWQQQFCYMTQMCSNPGEYYDVVYNNIEVPEDAEMQLTLYPALWTIGTAQDVVYTNYTDFKGVFLPYGQVEPKQETYTKAGDEKQIYIPKPLEISLLDAQADIYSHAIRVNNQISQKWLRVGNSDAKPLAQWLTESLLNSFSRPVQRIRGQFYGTMPLWGGFAHAINSTKVFLVKGATLNDKECTYEGEWLEAIGAVYIPPSDNSTKIFDFTFDSFFE